MMSNCVVISLMAAPTGLSDGTNLKTTVAKMTTAITVMPIETAFLVMPNKNRAR